MSIQIPMGLERSSATRLAEDAAVIADYLRRVEFSLSRNQSPYAPSIPSSLNSPEEIVEYIYPEMKGLSQEQLRVILLNTKMRPIENIVIYQGTVSSITIRPAEILRPAIIANAPIIALVHNHPSGDPTPSPEDRMTTIKVQQAAELMEIELADHIVLTDHLARFHSFARANDLRRR